MAGFPQGLLWRRLDTSGAEHVLLDDHAGLRARGTMVAAEPVPLTCRYELYTDQTWVTATFDATVEGPGFLRTVRLERAAGRWRVTAREQGNLDAALRRAGRAPVGLPGTADPGRLTDAYDVDLGDSPLTNTIPLRRLRLLAAEPGTKRTVLVAWVLMPSLEVVAGTQTYTTLGSSTVMFTTGSYAAELTLDRDGYVRHYPGLADRA